MEQNKFIPGTKQFKQIIFELKSEMSKTIDSIKDFEKKIEEARREDERNSPRSPLLSKRKDLNSCLKELYLSRKDAYEKLNDIKDKYGDLGAKNNDSKAYMSTESIDKRLKEIDMDMLKFPHSSQKSKEISEEIKGLKAKKMTIENEQKKHQIVKQMQERYNELKSSIRDLNKQISEKNAELKEIVDALTAIESTNTETNPLIEGYEKNIEALKNKKEEINKKIKVNQEEILKRKDEYLKYLDQKAIQNEYEERRKEILDRIKDFEEQKINYVQEQEKCDSSRYDSVIFALKGYQNQKEGKLSFPIDLVLSFTKFKVKIPSLVSQINETIKELEAKKEEFLDHVTIRVKEIEKKILEIDDLILQERSYLTEIPELEVKLPPFATKQRSK